MPTNAETVAKVNAAVQISAGLLLSAGKLPRLSSAALAISVVPGSLGSHSFWNETDPVRKTAERRALLADVGLIGGLIIASVDTEGKPSLGWRGRRAARKVSAKVTGALPTLPSGSDTALVDSELVDRVGAGLQSGLNVARDRGAEFAEVAQKRGFELAEVAHDRSLEFAETAQKRAPKLAKKARDRGADLAEAARDRGLVLAETAQKRAPEFAKIAQDRSAELAELAHDRGLELADNAKAQVKRRRRG